MTRCLNDLFIEYLTIVAPKMDVASCSLDPTIGSSEGCYNVTLLLAKSKKSPTPTSTTTIINKSGRSFLFSSFVILFSLSCCLCYSFADFELCSNKGIVFL